MLDVFQEEDRAQSNFRLYALKHAVAKDMAPLLLELTGRIREISNQAEAKNKETADDQPSQSVGDSGEISITSDEATNSLLILLHPKRSLHLKKSFQDWMFHACRYMWKRC